MNLSLTTTVSFTGDSLYSQARNSFDLNQIGAIMLREIGNLICLTLLYKWTAVVNFWIASSNKSCFPCKM